MNKKVQKALKHPNVLGAGEKARKNLTPQEYLEAVMEEYKRGTLHSGGGAIVKSRKQALKIGLRKKRRK